MSELNTEIRLGNLRIKLRKCDGVYFPSDDSILLATSIKPTDTMLEIGCGSGLISIYMAMSGATVKCSDIDPRAVACTNYNAQLNDQDIRAVEGDMFNAISGKFSTIVFNPPYLSGEDAEADIEDSKQWYGGKDGLDITRTFLEQCDKFLKKNGTAYIILSSLTDIQSLKKQFHNLSFTVVGERSFFFERIYCFCVSGFVYDEK